MFLDVKNSISYRLGTHIFKVLNKIYSQRKTCQVENSKIITKSTAIFQCSHKMRSSNNAYEVFTVYSRSERAHLSPRLGLILDP